MNSIMFLIPVETIVFLNVLLTVFFRQTKPLTFADCIGDELPVGWEEAFDPVVGAYYVDHNTSEFAVPNCLSLSLF